MKIKRPHAPFLLPLEVWGRVGQAGSTQGMLQGKGQSLRERQLSEAFKLRKQCLETGALNRTALDIDKK